MRNLGHEQVSKRSSLPNETFTMITWWSKLQPYLLTEALELWSRGSYLAGFLPLQVGLSSVKISYRQLAVLAGYVHLPIQVPSGKKSPSPAPNRSVKKCHDADRTHIMRSSQEGSSHQPQLGLSQEFSTSISKGAFPEWRGGSDRGAQTAVGH